MKDIISWCRWKTCNFHFKMKDVLLKKKLVGGIYLLFRWKTFKNNLKHERLHYWKTFFLLAFFDILIMTVCGGWCYSKDIFLRLRKTFFDSSFLYIIYIWCHLQNIFEDIFAHKRGSATHIDAITYYRVSKFLNFYNSISLYFSQIYSKLLQEKSSFK